MRELLPALDLLVTVFEAMRADYLIMGGLAVRAYSIPRATADIDVTLALDRDHLPELLQTLQSHDYEVAEPYLGGWVDDVHGMSIVKIKGYVGDYDIDVDIFLAESEYQREMLRRRRKADVEERTLWIASAEDLILLKLIAGRQRDMLDVGDLFFTQEPLDVKYMRHWAGELGISDRLEKAISDHTQKGNDNP